LYRTRTGTKNSARQLTTMARRVVVGFILYRCLACHPPPVSSPARCKRARLQMLICMTCGQDYQTSKYHSNFEYRKFLDLTRAESIFIPPGGPIPHIILWRTSNQRTEKFTCMAIPLFCTNVVTCIYTLIISPTLVGGCEKMIINASVAHRSVANPYHFSPV
jgi:transcription elongation factor Elf1